MPVHCIETVRNGAQASAFTNVVGLLGSVCCAGCVCAHAIAKVAKSAIEGVCNFRFFFWGGKCAKWNLWICKAVKATAVVVDNDVCPITKRFTRSNKHAKPHVVPRLGAQTSLHSQNAIHLPLSFDDKMSRPNEFQHIFLLLPDISVDVFAIPSLPTRN